MGCYLNRIRKTWQRWHIRRLLAKHPIPQPLWHEVTGRITTLQHLDTHERVRLHELATWFLANKVINGAHDLEVTPAMKVAIAAQACLLILNLDVSYFDGWSEIILYPSAFRVQRNQPDAFGLVHPEASNLSGEAWLHGPVILSWDDVARDIFNHQAGHNVVVHEFAHKLDGLNGAMNGMPPLRGSMHRERWTTALAHAYDALCHEVATGKQPMLNPYAATNPAEFFAVISEYFFTAPQVLQSCCPDVHHQLALFYLLPTKA
ncbi:MAG TPA: zinc-dependent peptidase [Halothiobacillus sp.]|nr:zinc-dependent peptidase [Halothiobacillus sp.]